MESNDKVILTIEGVDGELMKRQVISLFTADNGREYAALLQLNDDGEPIENPYIELVRAKETQTEDGELDYFIESIGSDVELENAKEAFERLVLVPSQVTEEAEGTEPTIADLDAITLTDGNGVATDWKIADVFDCDTRKYVALIPLNEVDSDNISIHLMRLTLTEKDGVEGCEITTIASDMEYEEAERVFTQRIEG